MSVGTNFNPPRAHTMPQRGHSKIVGGKYYFSIFGKESLDQGASNDDFTHVARALYAPLRLVRVTLEIASSK